MEHIDGHPVVNHKVRFTDRTDISDADAKAVRDGDTVIWIVQARCQPPSYHPTGKDSFDRYRFNIQKVERAAVLTGIQAEAAVAYLDDPSQVQGYLSFAAPRYPDLDEPVVLTPVPDTGEEEPEAWEPYPTDSLPLFDGDTRIVGSIYRAGHESETQRLLRETWG